MVSLAVLALMLSILVVSAGAAEEDNLVGLLKCCGPYKMVSADGKSCVDAPWHRNFSIQWNEYFEIVPPLDSEWVRLWFPPGLPMDNIMHVKCHRFDNERDFSSVNASSLWGPDLIRNEELLRKTVTFVLPFTVARPRPGGGLRWASYCVDAAEPPLGPFVMQFKTHCSDDECVTKCCPEGKLLKEVAGYWKCEDHARVYWAPNRSALGLDPEYPFEEWWPKNPEGLRPLPWHPYAQRALRGVGHVESHFSTFRTCFEFYSSSNDSSVEGLFYEEHPRIIRGLYWLLRPLCVVSALLLLAALVSVACNKSMRRKIHGRCLAIHAACLLAFNIGQMWYYFALSDELDNIGKSYVPPGLQNICKYTALWMYFLLTAAWSWRTALCVNMAKGFSLQVIHQKRESRKSFIVLSVLTWAFPVLLTISCFFLIAHEVENRDDIGWYAPTLVETRVCYNEYVVVTKIGTDSEYRLDHSFMKSGTALFYYGPVCFLVVCNVLCLVRTLKKVQNLKRGNSVLRREEDQIKLVQRHPNGSSPPTAFAATSNAKRNRSSVDAKTIKLYIKMILMTGGFELMTEIIMWSTTYFEGEGWYNPLDVGLPYRLAGYVTDFSRAAVVTWLAAPEGGYLGLVRRLRRGKGEKKKNVA